MFQRKENEGGAYSLVFLPVSGREKNFFERREFPGVGETSCFSVTETKKNEHVK